MDVSEEEVEKAARATMANKAQGQSAVSCDMLKYDGRPGIHQLRRVF